MSPTPAIVLLLLAAAAGGTDSPAQPAAQPAGGTPLEVGVVTVTPRPVTLTRELSGRTSTYRIAEVRARVNGIVQKRLFEEGADVKAGQPLFRIDPGPYRAAFESAHSVSYAQTDRLVMPTSWGELCSSTRRGRREARGSRARVPCPKPGDPSDRCVHQYGVAR